MVLSLIKRWGNAPPLFFVARARAAFWPSAAEPVNSNVAQKFMLFFGNFATSIFPIMVVYLYHKERGTTW